MAYIIYDKSSAYPIGVLTLPSALQKDEILQSYITPSNIPKHEFIINSVDTGTSNTITVSVARKCLDNLLPALVNVGVKILYVCNGVYFKVLTGKKTIASSYGYALPCVVKGYEHLIIILGVPVKQILYAPQLENTLTLTLATLYNTYKGTSNIPLGTGVIHDMYCPRTVKDIQKWLQKLKKYLMLTVDIETTGLNPRGSKLVSIAFAWDQHNGIAIPLASNWWEAAELDKIHAALIEFFVTYTGTCIYHNQTFDCKHLIYHLWMWNDPTNYTGLLRGLEVMSRNTVDTKIISYLALNSTTRPDLSLKTLAHPYMGTYGINNIDDILRNPIHDILLYNLKDCLATWYVYNTYYPIMVRDNQLSVYNTIFKPSSKIVLQMELTGLYMNKTTISKTTYKLQKIYNEQEQILQSSDITKKYIEQRKLQLQKIANSQLKTKVKDISEFDDVIFNTASPTQLSELLYEVLGLPVLKLTKKKKPSTKLDILHRLIHHTTDNNVKKLLTAIIKIKEVSILLTTFLQPFANSTTKLDNNLCILYGNFNIGGTVSGRLSSSKINLQNLPSTGNIYAKNIKECFEAPTGFIMVGADFDSLEDKISALTTKDVNKLKVYIDKYDGHCLRAYSYFGNQMPDIVNTVASINSIKKKYPDLRQLSKAPTFALTYAGTWETLTNNLGLPVEQAMKIEREYHKLYKISDEWVKEKIKAAAIVGYVDVAFGLRVRAPRLARTVPGTVSTPYEASEEARTIGNSLGQSYGMLTNRAGIEFQKLTLASKYREDILPIAHIHDALYFYVKEDIEVLHWVNESLIKCMQFQDLPELQHKDVKISATLEIFTPTWANGFTIPNSASKELIIKLGKEHVKQSKVHKHS